MTVDSETASRTFLTQSKERNLLKSNGARVNHESSPRSKSVELCVLIIEDNMVVGKSIERGLVELGFSDFYHVWSADEAVEAVQTRHFDLVVTGDSAHCIDAARHVCRIQDVPTVLITGDSQKLNRHLPPDVSIHGPFPLQRIEDAVSSAGLEWQS